MGKRRRARELALQYLYQWDFHGPDKPEPARLFWESRKDAEDIKSFAWQIVEGVKSEKDEIDSLIETHSKHWKLYRMSLVDQREIEGCTAVRKLVVKIPVESVI